MTQGKNKQGDELQNELELQKARQGAYQPRDSFTL